MDLIYKINSIYTTSKFLLLNNNENKSDECISNSENSYNSFIPLGIKLYFNEPINIIDNIYIGNIYHGTDISLINKLNINYVINFNKKISSIIESYSNKNFQYIFLELKSELANIELILDLIILLQTKQNKKTKSKSNILLTSLAGNNIPCIIMIAFLIYKYNWELKKALCYICKKIPNYNINKKYFEILKSKYS